MIHSTPKDLSQLSRFFIHTFPEMNPREQRLARTLYQLLALGEAVSLTRLAEQLDQPRDCIKTTLDQWGGIFYNDANEVIGFWGIAVGEMRHRMVMAGKMSYAWCAWDTLFIPELVGTTANISSLCATTEQTIKLTVTPEGIRDFDPNTRVSFLLPDEEKVNEDLTSNFCHFVYFFASPEAGKQWTAQHEGTFLLTVDEAYEVGKQVNATRYRDVL